MTEELVIREIRMNEAAGNSDSRMVRFEVIMPLKLQSTRLSIYSICDHINPCCIIQYPYILVIRNGENAHLSIEKTVTSNIYLYRFSFSISLFIAM